MTMHARLVRALSSIEPFTGLDRSSLEEVSQSCRFERFEARRQVIAYQDDSAEVSFIISGKVRVVIHSCEGKLRRCSRSASQPENGPSPHAPRWNRLRRHGASFCSIYIRTLDTRCFRLKFIV